ncbi:BCCT family transporter [Gordonia sp. (in: high G+C Gram-positive bacteria)]|uniref:BCCT family transporter n=1 Tax=Gordonia sp. (in: high G+C Gram-positive bacteria) TaxID=84139 RepID=UPI0025C1DCF4|nr:BCCT family transporter [Gordonia sp. (in: high G+C Gram-positive bacteria)]
MASDSENTGTDEVPHLTSKGGAATFHGPPRTDWWLYGVVAAISVGFIIWGFVSTDSLATTAQAMLDWLLINVGWVFVIVSTTLVVFVGWLASTGVCTRGPSTRWAWRWATAASGADDRS